MARVRLVAVIAAMAAATALGGSVTSGALASTGPAASQAPAASARSSAPSAVPIRRYNEPAAHSPKVLRMLASRPAVPSVSHADAASGSAASSAASQYIKGIDIADFQHPNGAAINWDKVAAAGYKFAFIKATEGSYYVNPYYASDAAAARQAGLFTAAYHFAIPNDSSGTLQADLAVDAADTASAGTNLPMILDIEYDPYVKQDHTNTCYGLSKAAMVAWVNAFVTEVLHRTGELPVIYSTTQWWNKCTGGSKAFSADPLWIAYYGSSPTLPAGWKQWNYWQYTSSAKIPGISVPTDVDRFNTASLTPVVPATQDGAAGDSASLQVQSLNAAAAQTLTWTASGLPAGLSVNPATGLISGTLPSAPGSYRVTVTMTDVALTSKSVSFTWDVHSSVHLIRPGRRTNAAGSATNLKLAATDGLPGCTLTFTATGLPPGLSISPCGQITGWAYRPGTYEVTVDAGDTGNPSLASVTFPWVITRAHTVATGQIRLDSTRDCLASQPRGGGATPQVRTCWQHSADQRWQLRQDGTLHVGGRCLGVIEEATGYLPALRPCSGRLTQSWQQADAGTLDNAATGLCLTHGTGTRLAAGACADTASQAWTLPAGQLEPDLAGRCVAATRASKRDPAHPFLARCAITARQAWTLSPAGTIAVGGRCLRTAESPAIGSAVTLAACGKDKSATARWEAIPGRGGVPGSGAGGTLLVNPASGLCLSVPFKRATPTPALALGYCVAADPRFAWRTS